MLVKYSVDSLNPDTISHSVPLVPRLEYSVNLLNEIIDVIEKKRFDLKDSNQYFMNNFDENDESELNSIKLEQSVALSLEILFQIRNRTSRISDVTSITEILPSSIHVIRIVSAQLFEILPHCSQKLSELSVHLGSILLDSASLTKAKFDFGNSNDDVHTFLGSTISGSSTSTGSFGSVHTAGNVGIGTSGPATIFHVSGSGHVNPMLQSSDDHLSLDIVAPSQKNIRFRSTATSAILWAIRATTDLDIRDEGLDRSIVTFDYGTGNVIFNEANAKISGSSTSTGSFGSAHIADKVGIGVTSPAAKLDVSGSVFPEGDNFHDLGSAAKRWANLYVGDMQLNNKGSGGNEVDGTEGNWTLQEGEENLYVINRKTGKKFKIKLEEM